MDLATVIGLLLAWGALIGSLLMEGGDARTLINLPAALLVFGGTLGAATVSFRMNQIMGLPDIIKQAFNEQTHDPAEVIRLLVRFAERARREGLLTLEAEAQRIEDPFLEKGVRLAIDGTDPEVLRDILTTEVHFLQSRHKTGENIFTTLGGFAGHHRYRHGPDPYARQSQRSRQNGTTDCRSFHCDTLRRLQRKPAFSSYRQQTQRAFSGGSPGARGDDRRNSRDPGGRQPTYRRRKAARISSAPTS
jgi:hypothetical protein